MSVVKIVVECKKSSKYPWVFFIRDKQKSDTSRDLIKHSSNMGTNKFFVFHEQKIDPLTAFLESKNVYSDLKLLNWNKKGTGYHEAFCNPDKPNSIYGAIRGILRKTKLLLDKEQKPLITGRFSQRILRTYVPVIVFDGPLFVCEFENQVPKVRPEKIVRYVVDFGSDQGKVMISIIAKDYFEEFSKMIIEDKEKIHKNVEQISYKTI